MLSALFDVLPGREEYLQAASLDCETSVLKSENSVALKTGSNFDSCPVRVSSPVGVSANAICNSKSLHDSTEI
jgi:hypothetical protein